MSSSAELGRPAPLTSVVNAVLRRAPLLLLLPRFALRLVQLRQRRVVVPADVGRQARVAAGRVNRTVGHVRWQDI